MSDRDAFETWYCAAAAADGLTFSPAEIARLRDGEYYGDRAALNGKWDGWKGRDGLSEEESLRATLSTSEASRLSVEGERDAYREYFEADRAVRLVGRLNSTDEQDERLANAIAALEHMRSQGPGPHPCGEQPGADVAATAALADKGRVFYRGWIIDFDPPPIPTRNCDWNFRHEDFDGVEAPDNRYGHAASLEDAKAEIDDWHEEHAHGDA